ncbi:MAG: N-6 DNA methylase [Candidatus Omnitrophica bacterium]|nr:N-6 DNA methylase [Candidatus Omnitrophota bacterium]
MNAPDRIKQLTETFDNNLESYKKGTYNETQVRREFIDPFFEELGWDIANKHGYAEAYKDVIHEDAIKVGGVTKAPDYCFRIGGARKFFLEAKKPSINIQEDIHPAYQLRRYGWSAKLPLSILTDFEEFAVYDCRVKPAKTDKVSHSRIFYFKYTDYTDRWQEIAGVFSRDAILKGSFDKYIESNKTKKGTTEVDAAFLQEIERWRELLARNIALRNPVLSQRDLNFAVQQTIDRIVFLRICEDRGMESYGGLMALRNGENIYKRLFHLFNKADEKYNSGLFHFRKEKGREYCDSLTPFLQIDDKPLKDIFKNLYYPDSPYEFSVLTADILGQVYEKFLGKVIRLTIGHQAKIEEKPEVRKAGGVYYTPDYIVDYIVKKTVGKLVESKKPGPRGGVSHLKILDPACGSGSFLIGVYQFLLDWHLDAYITDGPDNWSRGKTPRIYRTQKGEWRLTTGERKRILLNNIYGVDIDHQAVEVTKLSLLLKVLEGEDEQSIGKQMSLFQERVLPDLSNNIKCGNSLIGPNFYDHQQMSLLDEDEIYRVNAFDWNAEFKEIMKNGGFDTVIGNPPYGFHQIHSEDLKLYFKKNFASSKGSFEHYFLFYEKTLQLLKTGGLHGFIVPVTWLTIPSAKSLRSLILSSYWISEITWLPELVFSEAQVNTLISIIRVTDPKRTLVNIYDSLGFKKTPKETRLYDQKYFIEQGYYIAIFEAESDRNILKKITEISNGLSEFARPCSGYNPYETGKGIAPNGGPHTSETVKTKPYHSKEKINDEWKPEITGRDLGRYSIRVSGERWIKYGPWLAAQRDPENFKGNRILVQEITGGKEKRIVAAFSNNSLYHSRDVIPIKIEKNQPHAYYLLGILNSYLITWYHHKRNPKAQKGLFPKVLVSDLNKLPIRTINFDDPADVGRHDQIVSLVGQMLGLHKKFAESKVPQTTEILKRQIESTDRQIDKLVYKLYGLTDEEIKIVGNSEDTPHIF